MPLLRRRPPPDPGLAAALDAFAAVASSVERAQRALLAAIPTARDRGAPLRQALEGFEAWRSRAAAGMAAWRHERTNAEWERCREALDRARAEADRLRAEDGPPGFEVLNVRIGEVLDPLEAFRDAERALRSAAGRRR